MVRILLFGTGSVGTVYAMLLSKAGAQVTCVCRSNYETAVSNGFVVRSTIFGEEHFRPTVVRSVEEAVDNLTADSPFDFIVVCTKAITSHGDHSATDMIHLAVTKAHTSIVIIQNGLGVERVYRTAFPNNTIISGVTYLPTSHIGAGIVLHTETQKLHLGPYPAHTAATAEQKRTRAFADLIIAAGGEATVHSDVQIERWKKLIGNATWNPICALSRCRDLQFLQSSPKLAYDFVISSMREVVAVAQAIGYGDFIGESDVQQQIQRSKARQWPGVEPSMLADMRTGRTMEVEAVIGEVVKIAKSRRVEVPRLETLYLLLHCSDYISVAVSESSAAGKKGL
ncbi:ketopantoate reductase PanE/ApbA-domain-containing protein [Pyrenochaeta sp. MPI-SDFR-AT-0127]|nr:ketopantoate reductase PanE/ApbA-domain-containing protein [Pyrenochaeta sp. MPI-SDFR-AT-0127]